MKLCTETITVFNALKDMDTGYDVYYGTIIRGVSWHSDLVSTVDSSGLKAANKFTIRIPEDADCSGKSYLAPIEYATTADPAVTFTLKSGTLIVRGEVTAETATPAELKQAHSDFFTVLSVTDNRRAPNAKHFKVVGA